MYGSPYRLSPAFYTGQVIFDTHWFVVETDFCKEMRG